MRHLLVHTAAVVWLTHAVFGSCFHHSHPGAGFCSNDDERCVQAGPKHFHPHSHSHAHHHAETDQTDSRPDRPADHSCPGHHHNDDGSCGFVAPQSARIADWIEVADRDLATVRCTSSPNLSRSIDAPGLVHRRGPPLRPHLLFQILLI